VAEPEEGEKKWKKRTKQEEDDWKKRAEERGTKWTKQEEDHWKKRAEERGTPQEEVENRATRKLIRAEREALRTEEEAKDHSSELFDIHEQIMNERITNNPDTATYRNYFLQGLRGRDSEMEERMYIRGNERSDRSTESLNDANDECNDEDQQLITVEEDIYGREWFISPNNPPVRHLVVVGMDIWFRPGIGDCYKYTLIFVDMFSSHTWLYGMHGKTDDHICHALWTFFLDADQFPRIIQCDPDTGILHGAVPHLLKRYGIRVDTSPEYNIRAEDNSDEVVNPSPSPRHEKVAWDQIKRVPTTEDAILLVAEIAEKISNNQALESAEEELARECALEGYYDKRTPPHRY
jgi:hypothetical protein